MSKNQKTAATMAILIACTLASVSLMLGANYENGPGQKFSASGTGTEADPFIPNYALSGSGSITGTVVVSSLPAVTGTVVVSSSPAVTGTVVVSTLPAVTGTVALSGTALTNLGTIATSVAAATPAGELHIGEIGGNMSIVATEMTRVADTAAYAANDTVSTSTSATTLMTFTNVLRVNQGTAYITGVRIATDKKSITPRLRLHLSTTSGITVAADNALTKGVYADESVRLGYIDLPALSTPIDTTNSDFSRAFDMTIRHPIQAAAATRTVYGYLETLDAFTPASGQKITVTIFSDNN